MDHLPGPAASLPPHDPRALDEPADEAVDRHHDPAAGLEPGLAR